MIRLLAALALLSTPAAAQEAPQLGVEHRMLVRCSAAFAMLANRQAAGDAAALRHPAITERGREFFVRASARVMDEAGLDRDALTAAMRAEAQDIAAAGTLDQVLPHCLALLPPQ